MGCCCCSGRGIAHWFGQSEDAPVREASDHAAAAEDNVAGGFCDSDVGQLDHRQERVDSLFDFGDSTGADLAHVVSITIVLKEMMSSTMPTSSYSILLWCLVFAIGEVRA